MKRILLLSMAIIYISCDAPIRSRNPYATPVDTSNLSTDDPTPSNDNITDSSNSGSNNNSNDNANDNTNDNNSGESDNTTTTPGFENCNLGLEHNVNTVGNFGICKSTMDEAKFKVKFGSTDSALGTCFLPIHINNDGSSFYLGPAECVHHQANKVYDMALSKDRSENINGVMVVKYDALNAYLQCMTAKMQFMNNNYNCSYYPQCVQQANEFAAQVCSHFTQSYVGHYLQLPL